jgi:hypothetical protein
VITWLALGRPAQGDAVTSVGAVVASPGYEGSGIVGYGFSSLGDIAGPGGVDGLACGLGRGSTRPQPAVAITIVATAAVSAAPVGAFDSLTIPPSGQSEAG